MWTLQPSQQSRTLISTFINLAQLLFCFSSIFTSTKRKRKVSPGREDGQLWNVYDFRFMCFSFSQRSQFSPVCYSNTWRQFIQILSQFYDCFQWEVLSSTSYSVMTGDISSTWIFFRIQIGSHLFLPKTLWLLSIQFSSVTQSCPTLCDPMDCMQHARLPCPSPTPRACSNSCPSSQWHHPTISFSVAPRASCLQSFPASGSFLITLTLHYSQDVCDL